MVCAIAVRAGVSTSGYATQLDAAHCESLANTLGENIPKSLVEYETNSRTCAFICKGTYYNAGVQTVDFMSLSPSSGIVEAILVCCMDSSLSRLNKIVKSTRRRRQRGVGGLAVAVTAVACICAFVCSAEYENSAYTCMRANAYASKHAHNVANTQHENAFI